MNLILSQIQAAELKTLDMSFRQVSLMNRNLNLLFLLKVGSKELNHEERKAIRLLKVKTKNKNKKTKTKTKKVL